MKNESKFVALPRPRRIRRPDAACPRILCSSEQCQTTIRSRITRPSRSQSLVVRSGLKVSKRGMERVSHTSTGKHRGCRSCLRQFENREWPKVEVVTEALVKPRNRSIPSKFFLLTATMFFVGDRFPLTLSKVYAELLLSGWRRRRLWMVLSCLR